MSRVIAFVGALAMLLPAAMPAVSAAALARRASAASLNHGAPAANKFVSDWKRYPALCPGGV
jgi:hypothetical protein